MKEAQVIIFVERKHTDQLENQLYHKKQYYISKNSFYHFAFIFHNCLMVRPNTGQPLH